MSYQKVISYRYFFEEDSVIDFSLALRAIGDKDLPFSSILYALNNQNKHFLKNVDKLNHTQSQHNAKMLKSGVTPCALFNSFATATVFYSFLQFLTLLLTAFNILLIFFNMYSISCSDAIYLKTGWFTYG